MKSTLKILIFLIIGSCLYSCGRDIKNNEDTGVIRTNSEIEIVSGTIYGTIPVVTTVTHDGKKFKTTQNSNSDETSTYTWSTSSKTFTTTASTMTTSVLTEINQDDLQGDTSSCESNLYHKVQIGESWSAIAELYNVNMYQVAAANGCSIEDILVPGEVIIIPTGEYAEPISTVQQNEEIYSGQLLGSATVFSAPDEASWTNIEQAVLDINGLTLAPGEYFSWNNYLGWKTISSGWGYVIAPVIGGEEYGGGICVVSTALNMSARRCGIETDRKPHYPEDDPRGVTYAAGDDEAAVDYGNKDLTFSNPYNYTITFYATCSYGSVTVSCYARA